MSSKNRDGYHHMAIVFLVVFALVLGCAAGAVGINLWPAYVEAHTVVSR